MDRWIMKSGQLRKSILLFCTLFCTQVTSTLLYSDTIGTANAPPGKSSLEKSQSLLDTPRHGSKPPPQAEGKQESKGGGLVNILKTAVAWGLVPLSSEIALNISKGYLKKHKLYYLQQLLAIHGSNIRRSTSQHLTDNLSARLESFSYKTLSDEHEKKQTDELQNDLLFRSLFTFSILSMNAQKARKTFFRLQDILDNIAASARLAYTDGDPQRTAAMIALAAQTMIYIHPEAKASDGAESINAHFGHLIDWSTVPDFRQMVHRHLQSMDPLVRRSTLINLRYCDLLNQWQISHEECDQYENGAVKELEGMATMAQGEEQPGIIKSALKGVPERHIRNSIFIMGVSVPAVFLYFLNKKESPVVYTVVDHFARVTGMATTKSTIERFSSNTRRSLENWGAIDTGMGNSASPVGEFANNYFNTLQKNATAILAEQPNFARSNAQRALEALVINLGEAASLQRQERSLDSIDILAGALVQNYRENVEVTHDDSLIRSTLIAYRPLHNPELIPDIINALERLDPDYKGNAKVRQWYDRQIKAWQTLSSSALPDANYPDVPWISQVPDQSSDKRQKNDAWYQAYLPDKETISTTAIHSTALGYSIMIAMLEPVTIERLLSGQKTYQKLASYYLLSSMFDFGLRSLGEPAIVHLQTVIKNWIGNTTGILSGEDKHIQDELADKVNVLNRKLSIEAQTSRSYRATLEALLTRYWSLGNHLLMHEYPTSQAAAMLALAAYSQRYFHAEYTEDNLVIKTLAVARLKPGFDQLRQRGEMADFGRAVISAVKALDPAFSKRDVRRAYLKILSSWGLEHDLKALGKSADVLDSWASYGDYLLGAVGFSTQAMVKALFHDNEVISRSMANFFVNIFEYGTTDSLRKKIYAWSRLKMLNVVPFYPESDMIGVDFANQEMTSSFRRQKFYFGKPELDMRTQLVQIITAIANNYQQIIAILDDSDDAQGVTDSVEHLMALTILRLILFAPDISADDIYVLQSINILSLPIQDQLEPLQQPILDKVTVLLDELGIADERVVQECQEKASMIVHHWLTPQPPDAG